MPTLTRAVAAGRLPRLAVVLALLLVLAAAGCQRDGGGGGDTPEGVIVTLTSPTVEAPPEVTPTPTATPTPTPQPLQVCGFNPDPAPPSLLQIVEPKSEQRVAVPFHLRGWGSTIGLQNSGVAVAVLNANQQVVQNLPYIPPQPVAGRVLPPGMENTPYTRPFAADILLTDLAGPTAFCLWAYLETTPEGEPRKVVQVPVLVAP